MALRGINHLAFITPDMEKTIRFYRDLLDMELTAGIGHDGYRHYFFRCGNAQVAFFEYEGAVPMKRKFHGVKSTLPLGFDHVSFTVDSCEALFAYKDRLEAAGVEIVGAVDHGTIWSIYFFDPNEIPLEISWECMEVTAVPAIDEDRPMAIAAEGANRQLGVWPEPKSATPRERFTARPGNGHHMRETFLREGKARMTEELRRLLER
jgi:catechol 2,3-dioxygenase-like lactoylglutathione lyase family enzyme